MQENGLDPDTSEPSLDELRRMMAEKEAEKERERKRRSGLANKILIGTVLVVVIGVLCTPDREKPADSAEGSDPELAATVARIQEQLSNPLGGGEVNPEKGTAERDARRGDLRFARDLIQYVQPEVPRTSPPAATDTGER